MSNLTVEAWANYSVLQDDAMMIEPNNSEQLKIAIKKVLYDRKLQKRLTEHAYKTAQKFDTKIITSQFIELYKNLLKRA